MDIEVCDLCFDLPESAERIGVLRHDVVAYLHPLGLRPDDMADVGAIVTELATNAVQHGFSGNGYRVQMQIAGEQVHITVADHGKGFPASDSLPPPGTPRRKRQDSGNALCTGGWGLPLVCAVADVVEIVPTLPQGTTVHVVKTIHRATDSHHHWSYS